MPSKLTLHFQLGLPGWALRFLRESGVRWAKLMDPGDAPPFAAELPDLNWVIRFNEPENVAKAEVLNKQAGAHERLKRLEPELKKRPWLAEPRFLLEHMNEPSNAGLCATPHARNCLGLFTGEYTRILYDEYGIRSCAFNFGVGHPEPGHVGPYFTPSMKSIASREGAWAMHEYGYPTVLSYTDGKVDDWYTLRHRRILDALSSIGYTDPAPLHLTEAGIDRLLVGVVGGWKEVDNDPVKYVAQLAAYDGELQKREAVTAAYIFTASPEQTWWSYGIDEADAEVLARYIATGEIRR